MAELRVSSPLVTGEFLSRLPSADLHVSSAYGRAIQAAREWHNNPALEWMEDKARDRAVRAEEQRLATVIQAGRREVEDDPEVQTAIAELDRQKGGRRKANAEERLVVCLGALSQDHPARLALHQLVETHLEFAAYLARASVGILPKEEIDPISGATKSGRPKTVGAFADITRLHSSRAVLADRIQIANLALIEAAWDFKPSIVSQRTKAPALFMSFAEWKIHQRLQLYVTGGGEEPLLAGITASIKNTIQKDIGQWEDLGGIRQQEIIQYNGLHTPTTLESVAHLPAKTDDLAEIDAGSLRQAIEKVFAGLSDREKGVLRMRYGLGQEDGPKTLDQIAQEYSVTRERIRQIETKVMSKLRHPSRTIHLRGFINDPDPTRAETEHEVVAANKERDRQKAVITASRARLQAWQVYADESWDTPVWLNPEQKEADDTTIVIELTTLIERSIRTALRQPPDRVRQSLYPQELFDKIKKDIGDKLAVRHLVEFWHTFFESTAERGQNEIGPDFNLDRLTQLFSRLLAEYMKDGDEVELVIPEVLDGDVNYLGAWLANGTLHIKGNVGTHAGFSASGVATILIEGNAGSHLGYGADGFSRIAVLQDAGDFVGCAARGSAQVIVEGTVGDYCGYGLSGHDATITVRGDAGVRVGHRALKGTVIIDGSARSIDLSRGFRGSIQAGGIERGSKSP